MKILLVRLRLIGDVVLTTPLMSALRRRYPDAHLTYVVEPAAEPVVRRQPPPRRDHRGARGGAGVARLRDDLVLARAAAARAVRRRHRSAWRSAERLAHVGQRRPQANRLQDRGPLVDVHTRRSAPGRPGAAAFGAEPVGPARAARHRARASRQPDPMEMARDVHAAAFVERRLREAGIDTHPLVVIHVSAGNPFRRWPPNPSWR